MRPFYDQLTAPMLRDAARTYLDTNRYVQSRSSRRNRGRRALDSVDRHMIAIMRINLRMVATGLLLAALSHAGRLHRQATLPRQISRPSSTTRIPRSCV